MATRKQIASVNNISGGSNSSSELTDAGKYSYTALCALGLNYLFDNEWDKSFNIQCLAKLMTQLQLPKQVKPFMASILNGEIKQPVEPYIEVLKEEPRISEDLSILLHDLILLAVHEGKYDARWRVLVQHIAHQLNISIDVIDSFENSVVDCLSKIHPEKTEEEKEGAKSRLKIVKAKRYALIGLATLGGGALIGITGGLAAPLIASGLTTIVGGSAAILGTAAGVAVVGSMFGAAGAGLAGYKMHKRVGEIEEFAFGHLDSIEEINKNKESESNIVVNTTKQYLHITIAVTGWLKDEDVDNYTRPWLCMSTSKEQYYLRYESSYLLELGRAMDYIVSCMVSMATQEVLKYTALAGILSAVAWPTGLLGLASVIDNPWGVCCRRSAQVGKQLAEVLLSREQGYRPVTLIGYSLGARVIYYCLREMSERVGCEGIIQDAVLIGAPCSGNSFEWKKFTRVVAGRIVNAYCKTDWLLKFLYRTLSMPTGGVAGLQPITLDDRRMQNVDLSHIVSGHSEYPDKIYEILQEIGINVIEQKIDNGGKKISRVQTLDVINITSKTKVPRTQEGWSEISERFDGLWNFPHCLGAIDGRHCQIQAPANSGSDYYCYKDFFSIVLLGVADADYCFIYTNVGSQGRISDGGVLKNTDLWCNIESGNLHLPPESPLPGRQINVPYVFVADDAFALHQHFLKPYPGDHGAGSAKRIFNYRLSRARRIIENVFGILSSIFRVLRKPLLLQPKNCVNVVQTCAYLHNFLRKSSTSRHVYTPPGSLDEEVSSHVNPGSWREDNENNTSFVPLQNRPRRSLRGVWL